MLPINALATAGALVTRRPPPQVTPPDGRRLTVLISGGKMTKALQLARSFHAAGHRVILAESASYRWTGHRFSRAVDAFRVIPEATDPGYADAIVDIVRSERVDAFIPVSSPVASYHDAVAGEHLPGACEAVHADPDLVRRLDDKHAFARLAAAAGLRVPDTHRVTTADEVARFDFAASGRTYVLKSIAYDPVERLDLTPLPRSTPDETLRFARSKPISEDNPWILQEYITGTEYCTHSTVRNGRVTLYLCCESSAFNLNYAMVDKPEIEHWVTRFCAHVGATGQLSFDFIERDDGVLFAIECNPRTHSAITLMRGHAGVARAYLDDHSPHVGPLPGSRPTYWLYHELWRLLSAPEAWRERLQVLRDGTDAIFDPEDPVPFLLAHHLHIPVLLVRSLVRGSEWVRIDFNIGKLVQPAGD
jgi:hypothetical protein